MPSGKSERTLPPPAESTPNRPIRRRTVKPKKRRVPPPAAFFADGVGLRAAFLRDEVLATGPIEPDQHGTLYRFADGVWLPDGEREATHRAAALLQDRFRPAHAHNVVVALSNQPSPFSGAPVTRYLNLPNGLLDWRTGELSAHDPAVGILPRVPVDWDPDATCPRVEGWLAEVLPADCVDLAFEVIGYCLYNGYPIHKAVLLFGEGRNGKGTFLRLLLRLLGGDNVSHVTPQALDDNRFATAELYGKLANLVGDVDPRTFRVTEKFKQATGADKMAAERKHGQPFNFSSTATIVAAFNKLPQSADTTEGFFSRWVVLPFAGYFPDGVADESVEAKLNAPEELQGLLVRAVYALRRLMERRAFPCPPSVENATKQFRAEADPYRQFIGEKLAPKPTGFVFRNAMRDEWATWADANGYPSGRPGDLYSALRGAVRDVLGAELTEGKRRGVEGFRGVEVVESGVIRAIRS